MNDINTKGSNLPYGIIDAHAHFFPARWFHSIWNFFEKHSWRINYKEDPEALGDTLRGFGVSHFTVLNYLHKPGLRDDLAEWTRDFAASQPGAIPFGTLFPDEPGNLEAARRWFTEWDFAGLKIQPLVSQMPIGHESMYPVFELMAEEKKLLIVHAGTAPYPNAYTGLKFLEKIMDDIPEMPVILAHMGGYEFEYALRLMEKFPSMCLDTTMIFVNAEVFDSSYPLPLERLAPFMDRILFGSDFPSIPYDYSESTDSILRLGLDDADTRKIFRDNAARVFGL